MLAEQYGVIFTAIESQRLLVKERIRQALLERQKETEILLSIPGVELTAAFAYLGFLGTKNRFDNPAQVSYYVGMVPRVELSDTSLRAVYDRIAERRGKRIAIVAVARHMLELMYTLAVEA